MAGLFIAYSVELAVLLSLMPTIGGAGVPQKSVTDCIVLL